MNDGEVPVALSGSWRRSWLEPGECSVWCRQERDAARQDWWEAAVIAAASTVQAAPEVTAARVVLPERPDYRDLLDFRAYEEELGLRVRVRNGRDVLIERVSPVGPPPRTLLSVRVPRWSGHSPQWLQDLLLSTEGVR